MIHCDENGTYVDGDAVDILFHMSRITEILINKYGVDIEDIVFSIRYAEVYDGRKIVDVKCGNVKS